MNDGQARKPRVLLSGNGATYISRRDPKIVLWWSAAFPGFGHVLMGQYARGLLLTLAEVIINTLGHINEAIVYTLCGRFELATKTLEPQWMYGYVAVYFYAMWSSYRTAFTLNRLSRLSELENITITRLKIFAFEIQFLERKNPVMGALWSFAFPGLGFLYNQRIVLGVYAIAWWWIKGTLAHAFESLFLLFSGRLGDSVAVLNPQWLLFMPSILGGTIYFAYMQAIDQNRLFISEQDQFFAEQYGGSKVHRLFQGRVEGYVNR
ncbi:hypothetical protein [Paenibacillus kobensis]|uniref:hypothetical protein n=1 Tax=Paenibacillus kobensis TaxID=59841 RepID=UPI000FDB3B6A|nr:hypothetical protein [Paenibacillus kobensis]